MKKVFGLMLVLVLALVLAACGTAEEDAGNNGNAEGGSEKPEKLVMGFVPSQDSGEISAKVKPLANRLSEELGIEVEGKVMTNYNALIEAMGSNEVQIGFIPAFGYVLANQEYDVEVILKSVRYGSGTYKAQYVVRADSGIESLEDLEGKIWAYADPTSTSGYLFPAAQLINEFGLEGPADLEQNFFGGTVAAGAHDTAAIAVYDGDADVATTFDDVRTELEEDYPDVMEKLKVIGYTADIPNDTISVTKELDDELQAQIKEIFLSFNEDEEMLKIMDEVYNWTGITEATHEEYKVVEETYNQFKDSISF
ncbi:phosphonate transport system substrate-binding protein [Bacillus oleivorans]|uniref:Phosphonate transport system substrate-binding protein n=1 Tax=Bacillus oleivorans TaxID=1448271 RepID=A0A285D2F5_9BACI|nr:phosphate/phosphite/phosphonate ABC transporter substrate-binding protein [Bacillus oleivorans]SNX73949.1 phosphonate transport system substrate-binding protein [Bacillus oleivorans]